MLQIEDFFSVYSFSNAEGLFQLKVDNETYAVMGHLHVSANSSSLRIGEPVISKVGAVDFIIGDTFELGKLEPCS